MANRVRRTIGGGLLRLLADTFVLLYKVRHLCWRTNGVLGNGLKAMLYEEHVGLNRTADDIACRVIALGVDAPPSFEALTVMSSIEAEVENRAPMTAIAQIVRDHKQIVDDIETLQVTLPLENDAETISLLDRLAKHHKFCQERLEDLLQTHHAPPP